MKIDNIQQMLGDENMLLCMAARTESTFTVTEHTDYSLKEQSHQILGYILASGKLN
jgi:hypothetical protein